MHGPVPVLVTSIARSGCCPTRYPPGCVTAATFSTDGTQETGATVVADDVDGCAEDAGDADTPAPRVGWPDVFFLSPDMNTT
jgi:hypothetical protein